MTETIQTKSIIPITYTRSTGKEGFLFMSNNQNVPAKKHSSGLIPIFGAVALIICCAIYIVYKLTQHETENRWADYDECGWS